VTLDPRNFDPMRHEWWPGIASMFAGEWTREAAMMDLRWHAVEVRVFGKAFPSRRQLMPRWGWSERRVRDLLATPEEWQDPAYPMSVSDLRGEKVPTRSQKGPNNVPATSQATRANAEYSGERSQKGPNEVPERSQQRPQARSSPTPITDTDHRKTQGTAALAAAREGTPGLVGGEPRPQAGASTLGRNATPTPCSDEDALYAAYHGHRPRTAPTPTPDTRRHLRRILTECGGLERAATYLAWTFQSQDQYAMQLRKEAPWLDGKLIFRADLESLSVHVGKRMAQAEEWEARGRGAAPEAHGDPSQPEGEAAWEWICSFVDRAPPGVRPPDPASPEEARARDALRAMSGGWARVQTRTEFTSRAVRAEFVGSWNAAANADMRGFREQAS
jgi:hypothetical protein